MVIVFRGTQRGKNNAPQALAICAGISATVYKQKTLVVQLTPTCPIEEYLIGKQLSAIEITAERYSFEDSGIDSLFRRKNISKFEKNHFDNAIVPLVTAERLFDVMKVSKKPSADFERDIEMNEDLVKKIILNAKSFYENIFVYVSGKSELQTKLAGTFADKTVCCLQQGKVEKILEKEQVTNYLLTNFNDQSVFSKKVIAKNYGINANKLHVMPYNVVFHDYYTAGNALQFILHNNKCNPDDFNYSLMNSMNNFFDILFERKEEEEEVIPNFSHKKAEEVLIKSKRTPKDGYITFEEKQIKKNCYEEVAVVDNAKIDGGSSQVNKPEINNINKDPFTEFEYDLEDDYKDNKEDDIPTQEEPLEKPKKKGLFGKIKKDKRTEKIEKKIEEQRLTMVDITKDESADDIDDFMFIPSENKVKDINNTCEPSKDELNPIITLENNTAPVTIPENKEILYTCPNCGTQMKDNYEYCPNCGTSMYDNNSDLTVYVNTDESHTVCKTCGHIVADTLSFCPYCGEKIVEEDNVSIEEEIPSEFLQDNNNQFPYVSVSNEESSDSTKKSEVLNEEVADFSNKENIDNSFSSDFEDNYEELPVDEEIEEFTQENTELEQPVLSKTVDESTEAEIINEDKLNNPSNNEAVSEPTPVLAKEPERELTAAEKHRLELMAKFKK